MYNDGKTASATITRPADTTAYTAGDVVSTSAGAVLTFSNVGVASQTVVIYGAKIRLDAASIPSGMTTFRLHLYNASPTAITDNTAYDLPSGDRGKYLGYVEVTNFLDLGATCYGQNDACTLTCKLVDTNLYGILQTVGAYTPTSAAVKTITIDVAGV